MPKIKEIPKVDRPREKLEKYGPNKLADHELLAILLRTGTKEINVCELSKKILRKFKSGLTEMTVADLITIKGLGPTKALEIIACFELGRRFLKGKKAALIMTPKDVWEHCVDIRDKKKEHFIIFYLDTRNQEIQREIISVGTLNANLVHPREVFEPAIKNLAAQILVAHNHPSGNPEPSKDDIELSKRLIAAGRILGIDVIDHVVVSKNYYFSLKKEELI